MDYSAFASFLGSLVLLTPAVMMSATFCWVIHRHVAPQGTRAVILVWFGVVASLALLVGTIAILSGLPHGPKSPSYMAGLMAGLFWVGGLPSAAGAVAVMLVRRRLQTTAGVVAFGTAASIAMTPLVVIGVIGIYAQLGL